MLRHLANAARTCLLVVAAVFFLLPGANAEKLDASAWRFSVAFPCKSQLGSQTIHTAVGDVIMAFYTCDVETPTYLVAVNDYPKGTMLPEKVDGAYVGGITSLAETVKGTIRGITPYTLGGISGREAIVDSDDGKSVGRLRAFIVGDRLYQVFYMGPKGSEESKDCLDFLNSFTLIGISAIVSPPSK